MSDVFQTARCETDALTLEQRQSFRHVTQEPIIRNSASGECDTLRNSLYLRIRRTFQYATDGDCFDAVDHALKVIEDKSFSGELRYGNHISAESETWIRILRNHAFKTAYYKMVKMIRDAKRHRSSINLDLLPDHRSDPPFQSQDDSKRLDYVREKVLMSPLSKHQRLVDHVVHGLPDQKIAEKWGMTPNAAKTDRCRTKGELRDELAGLGDD